MDGVKIFKEYLARVVESANKPNDWHKQQLVRSSNELIDMFVQAKQEAEDQTNWADTYFKELQQKKNVIRELEGSLGWHIEANERYEIALQTIMKDSELFNTTTKKTTYSYPGKIAKKALEG